MAIENNNLTPLSAKYKENVRQIFNSRYTSTVIAEKYYRLVAGK